MFNYFKNIAEKNSCQSIGVCSVHPSVNALYELLMSEIRQISFYLVKLKEFNLLNKEIMQICLSTLSIFLINTNFNKANYLNLLHSLVDIKKDVKDKYFVYCSKNQIPCETINFSLDFEKNAKISELIEYSQNNVFKKQKNNDKSKQNMFDLIALFAKLTSINLMKIKKIDPSFEEYDFEILRFFALTNSYSIRNEKIKRRIIEFSNISRKIKIKLDKINDEKYGKKESASINTSQIDGHSILVSGDDLFDLENLLRTLEKMNLKEQINVYTHGALIRAHNYPYFKENKFLKGHLGTDNAEYDFSLFKGVILITKNFVQKIDSLYKGEIFSNKMISFERVIDIVNDDYTQLVETALKLDEFEKVHYKNSAKLDIDYNHINIEHVIENLDNSEIVIILGKIQDELEQYKNKKIIHINCPIEQALLYELIEKIEQKNIKTTIFISQCNFANFDILLSLLNKNIEIYLTQCSNILINPHIINALVDEFNVKLI